MARIAGIAVWAGIMATLYFLFSLLGVGWSLITYPGYEMRSFSYELRYRLTHIKLRTDHRQFHLSCPGSDESRRTVLAESTAEARDFLQSRYPNCKIRNAGPWLVGL